MIKSVFSSWFLVVLLSFCRLIVSSKNSMKSCLIECSFEVKDQLKLPGMNLNGYYELIGLRTFRLGKVPVCDQGIISINIFTKISQKLPWQRISRGLKIWVGYWKWIFIYFFSGRCRGRGCWLLQSGHYPTTVVPLQEYQSFEFDHFWLLTWAPLIGGRPCGGRARPVGSFEFVASSCRCFFISLIIKL